MICFSWIKYDDGTVSAMVLHEGSQEDCELVADGIPGITSSVDKKPVDAGITICSREKWMEICEVKP